MSNAETHAEIARKVYPDAEIQVLTPSEYLANCPRSRENEPSRCFVVGVDGFDLLEVDSQGNPTMQAKASSFDVLCWLAYESFEFGKAPDVQVASLVGQIHSYNMHNDNPCAAIFAAAKETIGEGES